jgi:hypothetical protein
MSQRWLRYHHHRTTKLQQPLISAGWHEERYWRLKTLSPIGWRRNRTFCGSKSPSNLRLAGQKHSTQQWLANKYFKNHGRATRLMESVGMAMFEHIAHKPKGIIQGEGTRT